MVRRMSSARARRRQRLAWLAAGLIAFGGATALVLNAFEESLVFFYTPTELAEKAAPTDRRLRIGGLVEAGSLAKNGEEVSFRVTDNVRAVAVTYRGILPDLFREGQGIVAQGMLQADGSFRASEVLAKHDENYMPPEVAEALKRSGQWQHGAPAPGEAPAGAANAAP